LNVMTAPKRVMIVDDHSIVIAGLRTLINSSNDFRVVAECTSAAEARGIASTSQADLAILDLRLGDALGPDLCRDVIEASPLTKVLMLTGFGDVRILRACLDEGASGILLKGSADLDLMQAMRSVLGGEIVVDPVVRHELGAIEQLIRGAGGELYDRLRPQEYAVLRLLAQGNTTREIGGEMGLTVNTVRSYIQTLMNKLDAHSRVQLTVKARELHLI
jgi:DNA-binding NarL/FixJ family response regulator